MINFEGGAIAEEYGPPIAPPVYPAAPHCNQRGLTDLGAHVVGRLMDKRMIVNPDHMNLLFRERMGQQMLMAAIVMQTFGFLWIKKIVKIEV